VNLERPGTMNHTGPPAGPFVPSESEQRVRVLELSVELLLARTKISDFWIAGFHDAARLLESVPLPTADFRTAKRHLSNAMAYCRQNEFGAAAFELRTLRGALLAL
jgi:hypothetical protein